jgi:hypothetical protein
MSGSTYSGVHPASVGDQLSYWVTYRPFSPVVLVPALGVLAFLGLGLGVAVKLAGSGKNKYEMLDDD